MNTRMDNTHPLMIAASCGDLDLVDHLAQTYKHALNHQSPYGFTALMGAVCRGHVDVADVLVRKHGAEVNFVDKKGFSALHLAYILETRHPRLGTAMSDLLLAHGARPIRF